jgi:hypothetical protein
MTRRDPQEPRAARFVPATTDSARSRLPLWLLGWALLVPLVHIPLVVVGELPPAWMLTLLASGTVLAISVPFALARSRVLDGLAAGLGRRAVALLWTGILVYIAASIGRAAWGLAHFQDYIMPAVFYPHLGGRMKVGMPVGVGENILDPRFRRGYEYVLVWRGQRPPDMPFDSLLIAMMPNDPDFEMARVEGPLVLYRNRLPDAAHRSRRP